MGFFFNYGIIFLCHSEILTRNTLDGTVHHPELEIIPHQVLCWKHLLKWSLGGLDCNAPGLSVILMFAWSAQRPFAGFHPKPKHCLCVIIDKGGHWGQPGGEWISQDGLPSPMNRCIPATSEGTGNWVTAVVFCGSACLHEVQSYQWCEQGIELKIVKTHICL